MTKTTAQHYCVYCGATGKLVFSEMVPDDTLYPGVQFMCDSTDDCMLRIHDKFHGSDVGPWGDCRYCDRSDASSGTVPS